ncbi:DUF1778 domain-containing protein [Polaromonas sp. P1(28)-13]|nr:DUF1778 domain-containing protein [Polaromonas sp. P1(28)-13]
MTTTARFDLKMDAADKDIVSRAATLMGTTMASFVRVAAKEKAQALLDRESWVTLSQQRFCCLYLGTQQRLHPQHRPQKRID